MTGQAEIVASERIGGRVNGERQGLAGPIEHPPTIGRLLSAFAFIFAFIFAAIALALSLLPLLALSFAETCL